MKRLRDLPLVAKVLGWLSLHLLFLALAFAGFVGWQLGLGLDSLLGGSAGERLEAFGTAALEAIADVPAPEWNETIAPIAASRGVEAAIFRPGRIGDFPRPIPRNVVERAAGFSRPPPGGPGPLRPGGPGVFLPPGERRGLARGEGPPPREMPQEKTGSHAVFLMRGDQGDGYWAGIELAFPRRRGSGPMGRELLLVRAVSLDGSGMFFDFKPWLLGGLAVLALSLAIWTPFAWSIARYLRKLTRSTERIAAGDFQVSVPPRGGDELGNLGHAIEAMAVRLDRLVGGQKRFLGDAAHELCAPLARLRTGLGILEMKLGDDSQQHLAGIESEAEELALLVEEILAFSRAGNRKAVCEPIHLKDLVDERIAREVGGATVANRVPQELVIHSDARLLGRSIGNLLRNAVVHGGADVGVGVEARVAAEHVEISVTDNGPGVAAEELPHLFEPFYRPDRSRSRDTGGSGLGLAIVRTAMDACGGKASASLPEGGGFRVTLRLPR
jgi:two-component system, OmpR family, sensor histidine kinase CpxA